eukprot:m.101922 g.101922  ORF g.101922 m.101922 type:complete len:382 (-) comp27365_c0_seq1:189-1334(-)
MMDRRTIATLAVFLSVATISFATKVTLSNVELPLDQNGEKIITGEADILHYTGGSKSAIKEGYYIYMNNWGDCPGVNCCDAAAGCATCCFDKPPHPYLPGCGDLTNGSDPYGSYHTIQAYYTPDFTTFTNLGVALTVGARLPGIEFRPHVVFNAKNDNFLMWFEDRGSNLHGYAIAEATTPAGPFNTVHYNVTLPGTGRTGDYDIFVDTDNKAYHVRTGFDVVLLNDDYTAGVSVASSFKTPRASEGPVVFARDGSYYVLAGSACCACIGGSTIYVLQADSMAGPWKYLGDVGSNPTKFDPHSPNNFVTKAQASAVVKIPGATPDDDVYLWMGNQWNSGLSESPPGPRKHDLLYWSVLNFNATGAVEQFVYQSSATFDMIP